MKLNIVPHSQQPKGIISLSEMMSTALPRILSGKEFLQSGQRMSSDFIKALFCSDIVNLGVELMIISAVLISQSSPFSSKRFIIYAGCLNFVICF